MQKRCCLLTLVMALSVSSIAQTHEDTIRLAKLSEVWQPEPRVITPGKTSQDAPSDAIVLFDGKDLLLWVDTAGGLAKWKLQDGYMQVVPRTGAIHTKRAFGDCQLHIEWRTPDTVRGDGQGRG